LLAAAVLACYGITRSLWLDEAWVANSVLERTWSGLFYYPDWLQTSPPLFLAVERLTVWLLGLSNFAFRLYPGAMAVEARIPEATREALISRGHKLSVRGPWSMASMAGIVVDEKNGVLSAGADPRVEAYAWAW